MEWHWNDEKTEARAEARLPYVSSNGTRGETLVHYRVELCGRSAVDQMPWRVMRRDYAFNRERDLFRSTYSHVSIGWAEENRLLYVQHGHLLSPRDAIVAVAR